MKRFLIIGIVSAFCVLPVSAQQDQEGVLIHNGFVTGNDYVGFTVDKKRSYAMGLIDGIFLAPFWGATKEQLLSTEECVEGMTDQQLVAIFEKYIQDNPARWHQSMHVLAYSAIRNACS